MKCPFGYDDGAYVLGALSPADRKAFEDHLSTCADCQRSVGELAGLPGLLSRVDAGVLESPEDDEPVPAGLLPALLRDVRRERRHRTWLTVGAAAAAAVVVGTATLTVVALNDDSGDESSAAPSATSSSTVTGRPMAPVGDVAGIQATLGLTSVDWGTKLELTCSYQVTDEGYGAGPAAYALVVHTRDGQNEQVATWKALPGRTMRLAAATSASRADIASVEMRTSDGLVVLELSD